MTVLLTGATGFVGSHLLVELERRGEDVVLLSSRPVKERRCVLHKSYMFTKEDFAEMGIGHIDAVVHLGAFIPKVSLDMDLAAEAASNIRNTLWLVEHLPNDPDVFVFASTVDVYGASSGVLNEDSPLGFSGLYGFSKAFCERMLASFYTGTGCRLQVLRLGHIYGPGEEAYGKFIPVSINRALAGQPVEVFTDGSELRSFLYIDDCCRAIANAISLPEDIGPINVVSGNTHSIAELAKMIVGIVRTGADVHVKGDRSIPTCDLVFDNAKVAKYLLCSETDFEVGLRAEIEYMRKQGRNA